MTRLDMRLEGLGAALAKFKAAGNKIPVRSLKKALVAGGKPIEAKAKADSPVDTGTYKRAQTTKAKSYRRGAYLLAVIGPKNRKYANRKNPAKYAHFVERRHGTMEKAARASFAQAQRAVATVISTNILGDFQ